MAKDKDYEPTPKSDPKPAVTPASTPGAGYTSTPVPPEELLTEQEQDVLAGGTGVGPAPASVESVPVETMEAQGIGPRDPYPTAETPPPPEADTTKKGKK